MQQQLLIKKEEIEMNLENFNAHQKVEIIQMLTHNQFEFKWIYDADELQIKFNHQQEWNYANAGFVRLIKDILMLHGYNYSLKEILDIFRQDERIHNIPPGVTYVEDMRDIISKQTH